MFRSNTRFNMSVQSKHQILRMAMSIAIGLALATVLIVATSDRPMTSLGYFFFAPLQSISYFNFWMQKAMRSLPYPVFSRKMNMARVRCGCS